MTNFEKALADAKIVELRDSNGKLNQTDRNQLRNRLLDALVADLNAVLTADGAIVEFEHDYWGSLAVEVSLKMKDPNYDVDTAKEEYENKVAKAEAKKEQAAAKAAERQAKADALKAAKEKKNG